MSQARALVAVAVGILALAACSTDGPASSMDGPAARDGSTDGAAPGMAGGPCFPNDSCFTGLRCVSGRCLALSDGSVDAAQADGKPTADAKPTADGKPTADAKPAADAKPTADAKPAADLLRPDLFSPDLVCVPSCSGQVCGGTDGCGGTCKTGSCLGPQDVCVAGVCQCQPSCSGFCGGPDGCGGTCKFGSCPQPNTVCNAGACVCAYAACGSLCCAAGAYCLAGACTAGSVPGWKVVSSPTLKDLTGVWGSAWNDIWAVGSGGTVLHYDGSSWSPHNSGTTSDLLAISGSAKNSVWAIANKQVLRHDGASWSTSTYLNTKDQFSAVYAAGGQAFVAGHNGSAYGSGRHPITAVWKTGSWTRYEQTGSGGYLVGIGGSSASDVWAQGWNSLLHYDGSWQPQTPTSGAFWQGIFGVATNDIWVAGWDNGNCVLLHYSGLTWTPTTCPTSQGLYDAHGTGTADVWAVGSYGSIIHYDGQGWAVSGLGVTTKTLRGVWAASPTDVWAVGSAGTLLHYTP